MNRLTTPEPRITIGTHTFADFDKLDRASLAHQLTALVDRIDEPITIALDGGWGSGKSFFLKLWVGEHKAKGGKAHLIYFDAFENDFLDDPLVGLVGAITEPEEAKHWTKKATESLRKWTWILAKPAAKIGLAVAAHGATVVAGAVADVAIDATASELGASMDQFWAKEDGKRAAMKGFRAALTALTAPDETGTPTQKIVLIIDELDRCRPDYALSMLETIKHFFGVPGVHFVLGVKMAALEKSVEARYGSGMGATDYLQKFVHLQVSLPRGTLQGEDAEPALAYFHEAWPQIGLGEHVAEAFNSYLSLIAKHRSFSLRDIQRLLTYATLLPTFAETNRTGGVRYALVGLLIMKVLSRSHYKGLLDGSLGMKDLGQFFLAIDDPSVLKDFEEPYIWSVWECILLDEPSKEAREAMGGQFGPLRGKPDQRWLRNQAIKYLETFTLPPDPA